MERALYLLTTTALLLVFIVGTLGLVRQSHADIVSAQYSSSTNYHYRVLHMPDLDQRRSAAKGIPGLPGNGNMYCVPTASMNQFIYAANHGFAAQSPGAGNYQSNTNYNKATNALAIMGVLMSTSASNGTNNNGWKNGVNAWKNHPLLITTSHFRSGTSFRNLNQMAAAGSSGAIVSFNYGRWNRTGFDLQGIPIVSRSGGHAISLVRAFRSGSTINVRYRDPASDAANTTQSTFSSTITTASPFTVNIGSIFFPQYATVHRLNNSPSSTQYRLIEGYVTVRPFWGLSFSSGSVAGADGSVKWLRPIAFLGQDIPEVTELFKFGGHTMVDLAMHPDTDSVIVALKSNQTGKHHLEQLHFLTEESEDIGIPDISKFAFGRNRLLYGLDGSKIQRFDTDNEWELINTITPTAGPFAALTYDDGKDQLVLLNTLGRTILRYTPTLGFIGTWNVPTNIPMAGDGSVAVNPVTGDIWFVTGASNQAVRVIPSDIAGPIFLLVPIPGVTAPKAIDFNDMGHMFVTFGGKVREFEADGNGFWHLVPNGLFDKFDVGSKFIAGKSRSNANDSDANDPFWNINPDELVSPLDVIELDCDSDLNFDRTVGIPDLLAMLANWGPCGKGPCISDIDGDRVTGIPDLLIMLGDWGACP